MKPFTIATLVATLSIALLRPSAAGAQRVEPPRFPLPGNVPAVVTPTFDHPGGLPQPPGRPIPRPVLDPRPPVERSQRSMRETDRFVSFMLTGMAGGMMGGTLWGARREATCGTCTMSLPGGQLFAGFIGGMGVGMVGGALAYVVTAPFRDDYRW